MFLEKKTRRRSGAPTSNQNFFGFAKNAALANVCNFENWALDCEPAQLFFVLVSATNTSLCGVEPVSTFCYPFNPNVVTVGSIQPKNETMRS